MTDSTDCYSISELAKEFDVTTRTIRHYEEVGLLSPKRAGQVRLYNRGDRTRLKLILRGKRLGFSLDESRDIIELYDPGKNNSQQLRQLLDKIDQQKQALQQRLDDIQSMLIEVNQAEKNCQTALAETESKQKEKK